MAAITTAIAATAVAGVGAYESRKAAKKSSRAQQDANEAQRKINQLKNKQAKRQFLRNFRQAQANVLSAAIAAGVGLDSSAFQGTLQSERSQKNVALREFAQMDEFGGEMTNAMNATSRYNARAATWGAVSNFASSFIAFPTKGS